MSISPSIRASVCFSVLGRLIFETKMKRKKKGKGRGDKVSRLSKVCPNHETETNPDNHKGQESVDCFELGHHSDFNKNPGKKSRRGGPRED